MNWRVLAGCAIFCIGLASPVLAQDNFPDTPENHWAYQDIAQLKEWGLVIGFPDGMFKGGRALSRYEFGMVIHRAWLQFKEKYGTADEQIAALEKRIRELTIPEVKPQEPAKGEVTKQELAAIKSQLDTLKGQMAGRQDWKAQIDALRKLSQKFSQDLASLGVDVAAMQKDMRSVEDRVSTLENHKPPIHIGGDLNVVGFGGISQTGRVGVSWTGNPVGADSEGNPIGLTGDLHVVHELGLNFSGEYGRGVSFEAEVVSTSLLPFEFGTYSMVEPGQRKDEADSDLILHHATVNWKDNWFGKPVEMTFGRVGYKSDNYFAFARLDPDPYVDISRWDNGKWYFDGGIFKFDMGSADLSFFGGKQTTRNSVHSDTTWAMNVGQNSGAFDQRERPGNQNLGSLEVETEVGTELKFNLGNKSKVGAQYILLDGQPTTLSATNVSQAITYNRMGLLGLNAEINLTSDLMLYGDVADGNLYFNDHTRQTDDNEAYEFGLEYHRGEKWSLGAGYRYVAPFFSAPGYWDRIGYWYNPRDIKGYAVWFNSKFNKDWALWLSGQFLTGANAIASSSGNTSFGLMDGDKIYSYNAYLRIPLTERWKLLVGWEGLFWNMSTRNSLEINGGDIDENYYTVEFTYDLGKNTTWRIGYQYSDYDNKTGSSFYDAPGGFGLDRRTGSLIFTQFGVGF